MLSVQETMELTKLLTLAGTEDTVGWISSHDEETCREFIRIHSESTLPKNIFTTGEDVLYNPSRLDSSPLIITRPGGVGHCSPDIEEWCELNNVKVEDFNHPVVIAKGVADCTMMFNGCKSFDQSVVIPESVTKCNYMFGSCISFNQLVTIPEGVRDCCGMFASCTAFNQPIIIPESVTNCRTMFWRCEAFNKPVTIPEGIEDCQEMFFLCKSLNQPIIIPKSAINCFHMFSSCLNFTSSIKAHINLKDELEVPKGATVEYY